eukprot:363664-Chlamydomonas_euryale.AAC.7
MHRNRAIHDPERTTTTQRRGHDAAPNSLHTPLLMPQEDFTLTSPDVFQSLIDLGTGGSGGGGGDSDLPASIEKLTSHLDVVESSLMREISFRSASMFEAAGQLQDLHRMLCRTLDQIKVWTHGRVRALAVFA